ncbi:MAG TPA: hypothetical protein VFC75_02510, partial [Erysipelothrix sp.]|nr:hypothetical protein [Erysipelothrix sp.]
MDFLIGLILLCSFFGFVLYSYKGYNIMIGFVLMSLLWTLLPVLYSIVISDAPLSTFNKALNIVYQTAPENWGAVLVNIFFGAFFGRVLLDTNIAKEIITQSIEVSGDNPIIVITLINFMT